MLQFTKAEYSLQNIINFYLLNEKSLTTIKKQKMCYDVYNSNLSITKFYRVGYKSSKKIYKRRINTKQVF